MACKAIEVTTKKTKIIAGITCNEEASMLALQDIRGRVDLTVGFSLTVTVTKQDRGCCSSRDEISFRSCCRCSANVRI